jgi:hypothetical protein
LVTNIKGLELILNSTTTNEVLKSCAGVQISALVPFLRKTYGVYSTLMADQVLLRKKAEYKLSHFVEKGCWLTRRSFEQCSSEATALFKSNLFSGNVLLDLCAGLGIDDMAFSRSFQQIVALDTDSALNLLVRRNNQLSGIHNIERIDSDADMFMSSTHHRYDLIYADADRRSGAARSHSLSDCTPDILRLLPRIFECTDQVLLKLSPLFDIHEAIRILPHPKDIYAIEWDGEVKEILVALKYGYSDAPVIHAVRCNNVGQAIYHFSQPTPVKPGFGQADFTSHYLYEPSPALIKSGLTQHYLAQYGLTMPDASTFLALGNEFIPDFFGRIFKIKDAALYSKRAFADYLAQYNITQAHISVRHFPTTVADFRKQWKLKDGGDVYFFLTQSKGEKWFICAEKP